MGEDRQAVMATLPSTPFEEVRDFFYLHHNYIEEIDEAAEAITVRMQFPVGQMAPALSAYLENHHGVKILPDPADEAGPVQRIYDPTAKTLRLAQNLRPDSRRSSSQPRLRSWNRTASCVQSSIKERSPARNRADWPASGSPTTSPER